MTTTNIYLVGMMGVGKTTVGRHLARRLQLRFVDADREIEARAGTTIPTIFELEGEAGFRRREAQVIDALCDESGLLVATGGGAVMNPDSRARLAATGMVIYLNASPDVLFERTRHDRNRPLLQVDNPRERIASLFALRDPLYREIADLVVEARQGSPNGLAKQLEKELRSRCAL